MKIQYIAILFLAVSVLPQTASAHRSGCHNLHTCPSDSATYTCGDLGYPCNGATSVKDIPLSLIAVPLVIEKAFLETYSRTPTDAESKYWKNRFRGDKDGLIKIRKTMAWHKAQNSAGPKVTQSASVVNLSHKINALFRAVHDGRNPTASEHAYWLSRLKDKKSEVALIGAMAYHKAQGITH